MNDDDLKEQKRQRELERQAQLDAKREHAMTEAGRALAEIYFLDAEYREEYVYEHRNEVLREMRQEVPVYEKLKLDPDWKADLLVDAATRRRAEAVWHAKKQMVALAGTMTRGDRTTRTTKEIEEAKHAMAHGLTLKEIRTAKRYEPKIVASLENGFTAGVRKAVVFKIRALFPDDLSKEFDISGIGPERVKTHIANVYGLRCMSMIMNTHNDLDDHIGQARQRMFRRTFSSDDEFAAVVAAEQNRVYPELCEAIDEVMAERKAEAETELKGYGYNLPYEKWAQSHKQLLPKPKTQAEIRSDLKTDHD